MRDEEAEAVLYALGGDPPPWQWLFFDDFRVRKLRQVFTDTLHSDILGETGCPGLVKAVHAAQFSTEFPDRVHGEDERAMIQDRVPVIIIDGFPGGGDGDGKRRVHYFRVEPVDHVFEDGTLDSACVLIGDGCGLPGDDLADPLTGHAEFRGEFRHGFAGTEHGVDGAVPGFEFPHSPPEGFLSCKDARTPVNWATTG